MNITTCTQLGSAAGEACHFTADQCMTVGNTVLPIVAYPLAGYGALLTGQYLLETANRVKIVCYRIYDNFKECRCRKKQPAIPMQPIEDNESLFSDEVRETKVTKEKPQEDFCDLLLGVSRTIILKVVPPAAIAYGLLILPSSFQHRVCPIITNVCPNITFYTTSGCYFIKNGVIYIIDLAVEKLGEMALNVLKGLYNGQALGAS